VSDPGPSPFKYHLELTPAQLKLTHDALRDLLDGLDENRDETRRVIGEVLEMLPDEHAIAAIRVDDDGESAEGNEPGPAPDRPEPPDLLA
jgi:3-dehydroquinate dehydratase